MAIWLPNLASRSGPKYAQIVDAMAEDIASGRLAPGARLPPHRELAYQLGVSANTTSRAYAEAVSRALLRGEVGRGTFVRAPETTPPRDGFDGLTRDTAGPIDLSRNLPLPGFAAVEVRRILADLSTGPDMAAMLDYQTPSDRARHEDAGAAWVTLQDVPSAPEDIVVTMGGQHGILCALMALTRPGDLLLTEALTYTPVHVMAEHLGLRTATVAMDEQRVSPDAFATLCETANPAAFYLTPTLQAPTTVTLPASRRRAIVEIARRHEVTLIEDDVFGPLKTDRPPALATLAPERTVYVTSLSKSVAPGLRAGFLKAPRALVAGLRHAVGLSMWMPPPLGSEIAGALIRDGVATRLAAAQRAAAARRQAIARDALSDIPYLADPEGLHVWIPLPEPWRSDVLRARCESEGVLISEGRSFAARAQDAPEAIRLCLSHEPDETRVAAGVQTVASILKLPPSAARLEI